jgi:ascorbate PTS system EIIA or EIIAB component
MSPTQQAPDLRARVAVAAADWRAAVRAACAPLAESGALEPRYAERCIALVEQYGPYIVLAPGLALAHARPEDGVRRLCVSAAVLSHPVQFGHPDNDPVDVVFAFGSPDSDQHVGLLAALANHLQSGLDQRLRSSTDDAAAERVLAGLSNDVQQP